MNNQKITNFEGLLLNSAFGQDLLHSEEIFYHNITNTIFGYYAIQIGLPKINFLQTNKITHKYFIPTQVNCDLKHLPFATNSIDLILCPHILEFNTNYTQILHECYRILIPKGKLIITNFNQPSWLSLNKLCLQLCGQKHLSLLHNINYITLDNLKTELIHANFILNGGKFFSYLPPINNRNILAKLSWLNKVGDRWLPTLANTYAIIASKEIVNLTPTSKSKKYIPRTKHATQLSYKLIAD